MDYAEMVSQIMAAEQGAKVLAEESRARRQQLQAGLEQEISAMRESYLARARQRLEQVQQTEEAAAEEALRRADALDIADRMLGELSGGQRQRAYLAMALAQGTDSVLMDEPTTFLDISHQLSFMQTARSMAASGKAVVIVLHDLCMALKWADTLAVMRSGEILYLGSPAEVFESGALSEAMDVDVRRVQTGEGWQYYYA